MCGPVSSRASRAAGAPRSARPRPGRAAVGAAARSASGCRAAPRRGSAAGRRRRPASGRPRPGPTAPSPGGSLLESGPVVDDVNCHRICARHGRRRFPRRPTGRPRAPHCRPDWRRPATVWPVRVHHGRRPGAPRPWSGWSAGRPREWPQQLVQLTDWVRTAPGLGVDHRQQPRDLRFHQLEGLVTLAGAQFAARSSNSRQREQPVPDVVQHAAQIRRAVRPDGPGGACAGQGGPESPRGATCLGYRSDAAHCYRR